MKAYRKLDTSSPEKCRVLSRVLLHSPGATPDLNMWLSFLNWHYLMSYFHKIDRRRLTNVWFGSFKGSETLGIYIYSSLTVWRQSIDIQ